MSQKFRDYCILQSQNNMSLEPIVRSKPMIEVLSKPSDQISISDIESLIDSQVPESEQIEFKESLPAKKGNTDPWIEGKNIGDRAKNEIL